MLEHFALNKNIMFPAILLATLPVLLLSFLGGHHKNGRNCQPALGAAAVIATSRGPGRVRSGLRRLLLFKAGDGEPADLGGTKLDLYRAPVNKFIDILCHTAGDISYVTLETVFYLVAQYLLIFQSRMYKQLGKFGKPKVGELFRPLLHILLFPDVDASFFPVFCLFLLRCSLRPLLRRTAPSRTPATGGSCSSQSASSAKSRMG
jgi:hypothetical protein